MKQIGELLKKMRIFSKMSVEEVAKKVGISSAYLYQIEDGRKGLYAELMRDIVRSLGISKEKRIQFLDEFIDGKKDGTTTQKH